jgi:sugar phosphate isomerase/epimerase
VSRVFATAGAVTRWPDRPHHTLIPSYGRPLGGVLEVMVFPSWYERLDVVARDLRASGLAFPVVHADKSLARDRFTGFDANCRFAAALGAQKLVLHLWELPDSDRRLERELRALPRLIDTAAEHGLTLAVESIPCQQATPLANLRRALERDDRCRLTLDTEFLAVHEELGAVGDLWPHVAHLHVRDYDGRAVDGDGRRRYLLPGEGSLDLVGFLGEARARGYRGTATLEASAIDKSGDVVLEPYLAALSWLRDALP